MSLKKDKQKVLGEVFDDARIKTFLDYEAYGDANRDFHVLEKAYRGMKAENFETFVRFFKEDQRDINAVGPEGKNILQVVREHRHGSDYETILTAAGAQ
ncbi:MAG: hypothetical protein AseanaTS_22030 [Candidatus Pelagadaptatus aseana]|uniref:PA4642 family protein n=1 Tax=Candidatus Pelagadaptatus aseana TaxID=3120508 RepID=UPI0039B273AF